MKPVLIIGSTCLDIIINVEHLPKTEENVRPNSQTMSLGGCAYNVAYTMKLLQTPYTFISPVGGGLFGDYVKKRLKAVDFPVSIYLPDQENGCCYCFVEPFGERTFMSYHGIEYSFQKEWMLPYPVDNYSMIYICGLEIEEPTGKNLIEYLEENPGPDVVFAPGPRGKQITDGKLERMMALHPVLHINEQEALELGEASTITAAAVKLQSITQNTVIITLGSKGTYCLEKDGTAYSVPSVPALVVDTIGAGDSHIATIMACLSQGAALKDAISTANCVAAAVVSTKGSMLTPEQMQQALLLSK